MPLSINKRVVFGAAALFALGACLIFSLRSSEERLYAALLQNQAALERMDNRGKGIRDWATAFFHLKFKDPRIYYEERHEDLIRVLTEAGYLVSFSVRIPNLEEQAKRTQVSRKLIGVYELNRGHAWYRSAFNFDRQEVSVLCRKRDMPMWENALKLDSITPVAQ